MCILRSNIILHFFLSLLPTLQTERISSAGYTVVGKTQNGHMTRVPSLSFILILPMSFSVSLIFF